METFLLRELIWRGKVTEYIKMPLRNNDYLSSLDELKTALQHLSPVEITEEIVTRKIYDYIVINSVKCAASKVKFKHSSSRS